MSTKPKTVVLSWKYRNESFAQWREAKTVDLNYDLDIDGAIVGVQNEGVFNVGVFDPGNERLDVVAVAVSAMGKRIRPRLIPLGAANTPLVTTGGVTDTATTFEVTEPTTAADFSVNDFAKVDNEFIQITNIVEDSPSAGTDTWTVRRGEHASNKVSHLINATIVRYEWSVGRGYKQIILTGTPETGLPGAPLTLGATAFSDALGNAIQVTVKRPDTGSRTLRHLEVQAKTTPVWSDSNEHVTGLKTIRTTGTGTVTQGGSTLVTSTDLTASGVIAGDECYTHEAINLTTGEITWPRSARIKTVVDNGDSTWTITLIDDATFSLSAGETATVNFIAAADWQAVPADFEFWDSISIPERWTQVATDPLTGSTRVVIRTSNTVFIRARWSNLNGTGPWFYWDGTIGTTTKASAVTISTKTIQPAAITKGVIPAVVDINMVASDNDTVAWSAGNVAWADGTTEAITTTGSPKTLAAPDVHFVYKLLGNSTLQFTTTFSTAVGNDRVFLGQVITTATTTEFATIFLFGDSGGPIFTAAVGSFGKLSALTADLGAITAGTIDGIVITGGTFRTSASGERVEITAGTKEIRYFDGAGANVVALDYEDVTNRFIINVLGSNDCRILANTVTLFGGGIGNLVVVAGGVDIFSQLNMKEANIINVGDIALDSLTKDGAGSIAVNDGFDMNSNTIIDTGDITPSASVTQSIGSNILHYANGYIRFLNLKEASAPGNASSTQAWIYLDTADGDLKVRFDSGAAVTIAVHP